MKVLALATWAALFFQFSTNPAPQQQPSKGSIEGVVVRPGTGQPVSGARVTATRQGRGGPIGPAPTAPATAGPSSQAQGTLPTTGVRGAPTLPQAPSTSTTDDAGHFAFQNLDAGSYTLQIQANGYVKQNYGQRFAGGPGIEIALAAGQQLKDVSVNLTPAGNISGRIRDTLDLPLADVPVQLLRSSYNETGRRTFQSAGTVKTDDRGEYRIYWVTPGRYYLMAGHPADANDLLFLFGPSVNDGNHIPAQLGYAYYPGVTDIASARALDIEAGSELQAIDMTLMTKPKTYRVRGRVIDSRTGQAPARASLAASSKAPGTDELNDIFQGDLDGLGGRYHTSAGGAFEIPALLPGTYTIAASVQDPPVPGASGRPGVAKGSAVVAIADSDVDGIVIRLLPAANIPGRLRWEGKQSLGFLPLRLTPLDGKGPDLQFGVNNANSADGTFRIKNLVPGEYRIGVSPGFPGGYIKEARFEGVDVLNAPLRFSGSVSGTLDLVVTSGGGQVNGVVTDARSQPAPVTRVVLAPERARDRAELYKSTNTDSNGRFTISGIPPGDYKVFSWENIEQNAWFDPDVLSQSEASGSAVHVTESSSQAVEVKLIPAGGSR
jgi:hypothetical protein